MPRRASGEWSWTAAPGWRARMLFADLARIARGVATAARLAVRSPAAKPCLAFLEGPESTRPTMLTGYRLQLHNPGDHACRLAVAIRGERSDRTGPTFALRATTEVPAGSVAQCWLVTDWVDLAELREEPPPEPLLPPVERELGRWWIDARIEGSDERLRIEGSLHA
jgi:hypothetical protein